MRISEILNEEVETCPFCKGDGKVVVGDIDGGTVFDCPDCKGTGNFGEKEEIDEIKVTKTLAGKRQKPSRDLAMKKKKKSPNQGKPACEIRNKSMKQLADITLKGEY